MRRLFIALVPGTPFRAGLWLGTATAFFRADHPIIGGLCLLPVVLNLYSALMQFEQRMRS